MPRSFSIPDRVIKKYADENNLDIKEAEEDIESSSILKGSILTLPDGTQYKLVEVGKEEFAAVPPGKNGLR